MFKKIIITLIVFFVLAAAALAIFIATFDAERYRPLIETKATELTGFPVKLGGLSLTWKNGLALQVRDLELKIRKEDTGPAPVSVRSAFAALEVMPLLRGSLQMGSIIVEDPEVRVTRSPDGRLHGAIELAEAHPEQQTRSPSGAESTLALLIQNLNLRGGRFVFQDQSGGRVTEYSVDQIELHLHEVSLLRPFSVELKAALFSGKQNVTLTGKVHARLTKQEVELQDFVLSTDLEDLDADKLAAVFPELKQSGVPEMSGKIQARLDDVTLSEKSEPAFNAQVTLSEGRLALPDAAPLEEAALAVAVRAQGLKVTSLSGNWGGGQLTGFGNLDWSNAPVISSTFQAALAGADLQKIVPRPANAGDPGITGILSAGLTGSFAGANAHALAQQNPAKPDISQVQPDADVWMRTLKGEGQVTVKDGVITNLNILREVLNKLSMIPGVSQTIQGRLSEEYLKKLQERDTRLDDMDLPVRIRDGSVFMNPIVIKSDTFQINGQVQAVLAGPLNGRLFAAIDQEFSAALIRSVNELSSIADQSGQITVPLTIRGTLQKPEIVPEVQQLASRLAVAKTQELISGFLNKKKTGDTGTANGTSDQGIQQQTSSGGSSQQSAQPVDPFAALLGQVLQAATKKEQ